MCYGTTGRYFVVFGTKATCLDARAKFPDERPRGFAQKMHMPHHCPACHPARPAKQYRPLVGSGVQDHAVCQNIILLHRLRIGPALDIRRVSWAWRLAREVRRQQRPRRVPQRRTLKANYHDPPFLVGPQDIRSSHVRVTLPAHATTVRDWIRSWPTFASPTVAGRASDGAVPPRLVWPRRENVMRATRIRKTR